MVRLISFIIVAVVYCIGVSVKGVQGNRSMPGYVFRHDAFVYKFITEQNDKRTWVEARKICQEEENGELLTFGDPEEAAWVNRLIANLTGEMGHLGRFWLGATDKRLRGIYEYVDNSPFKFKEAPWAKGEPNRPTGYEYNYCIVMDTKGDLPEWSDEDCFQSFGYICKASDAPRRLRAVQRFGYSWEWNYYDYKFVILPDDSMTWSEAEIYCQEAESGHLLSIYNSKESEWVTDRIRQIRRVLGFRELWIGATDIFNKGHFKWTDEKPVNYTKWRNGTKTMAATKPREACVSILAHPNWGDWNEEYCIKKLPFVCKTKMCQGKSDLVFIVDASGSVTESGFEEAKSFMFQVIRGFQFKDNQTNVALIGFSDQADLIFGFNTYYKQLQIKKAIDNMPFTKGETYTDKALNLARTAVFSNKRNPRDAVPKIALLLTDGKSKEPLKTALAAKKLKEEGVTIVTLGIGDGVDRKELTRVASNYNDALYVQSYAQLGAKVQDIQERVCDEIVRIGLIQEKIRAAQEKRRLALEAKQRLEAEKKRKQLEEQRKRRQRLEAERKRKQLQEQTRRQRVEAERKRKQLLEQRKREEARKRKLEIERRRQEARRRQEEQRKREQERRREEARKRLAQRNRYRNQNNQRNRNTQNRYNQRNRNTQNRGTPSPRNQSNRNMQNRNMYNRNTQNRNRNTQNRYNQRNTQNRNRHTQNRNIQNRYNQNRNLQNRYNQLNRNTQNRNIQNRYNQNRNMQNRNNQRNRNTFNRNTQNRNTQNRNIQNRYNQNRYNQRNRNILNRNTQNRNTQNRNVQSRNRYNQNRYNQNRNTQSRYNQNRNTQNRYNQNRNTQNRYNQNRNTQNRYNQNRNTQNRYNQNRNTQNRNTQNRYNQNRYNQNRNTQSRYNQNRNTQSRYNQNRNTQSRYNQNRNTQNGYNQNRNTQNRYNRNRYNRNRYQG